MVSTYENIRITTYNVSYIKDLKIMAKINEHTTAEITAVLDESEKDNPIYNTSIGTEIDVLSDLEKDEIIFTGTVSKIKVLQSQGVYYLQIKAVSNSKQMDIKAKSRSFQDKSQLVKDIVKKITKEYANGDVIDMASNNKSTEKFIMQYEETDWEFIKRIASFYNVGLVPDSKSKGVKYFFGIPKGEHRGNLNEFNYSVTKEVTDFLREKENENKDIKDLDKVFYEIESYEFFNIGDTVVYEDVKFYVNQYILEMKNSRCINTYFVSTKKGCSKETIYNNKIIGLSLQGSVIQTANDDMKLHLSIDDSQNVEKAHFFKHTTMYTASGNSGLYLMPELGDTVYAYFPTKKEWEGVTQNSVRTQGSSSDKTSDPNTKYLRTKFGKEVKLAPDEVLITCVDDEIYMKLNQSTGIEFFSTKPIKINTQQDLTIESQANINITAKDKIDITCKSSRIKMDGSIHIHGKEVRHN